MSETSTMEIKRRSTCKLRLCLEVVLLCAIIVGTWSMLLLPVILYHFQVSEDSQGVLNGSLSTNGMVFIGNDQSDPNGTTLAILECTEGFYQENDSSVCTPSCYTWNQYSKRWSILLDVVEILSASAGFLVATAIIIISCLVHKRMLIFPSIFIVYLMIDILINTFIILVGHMDRSKLFCSSRSLLESLREVTPFCVAYGIIYIYTISQIALWWIFHITTLFWKVVFPFHAQSFEKVKYIHITSVILGILFPLVPIITTMADFAVDLEIQNENSSFQPKNSLFLSRGLGFGPTRFPPTLCLARDTDIIFYTIALNIGIILASGCTMLTIVFWTLHKISRRRKEKKDVKFKIGAAEKKLLIVFTFTLILDVFFLILLLISGRNASKLTGSFQQYFLCEQGGHNPSNPCSRSEVENLTYPSLEILTRILQPVLPAIFMIYVVNIQEMKKIWRENITILKSFAKS